MISETSMVLSDVVKERVRAALVVNFHFFQLELVKLEPDRKLKNN